MSSVSREFLLKNFPKCEFALYGNYINRYKRLISSKVRDPNISLSCNSLLIDLEKTKMWHYHRCEGHQGVPPAELGHEQAPLHIHGQDDLTESSQRHPKLLSKDALQPGRDRLQQARGRVKRPIEEDLDQVWYNQRGGPDERPAALGDSPC